MEFKYFNPNPEFKTFKSGKAKSWYKNDFAVRALCAALNITWDEAYEKLVETGKKLHNMPDTKEVFNEVLLLNGFIFETLGKPKVGTFRKNISEFMEGRDTGIYILNLAGTFVTVKNGELLDVRDLSRDNKTVYSYWYKA